jgi:uncharacterized protein YegL
MCYEDGCLTMTFDPTIFTTTTAKPLPVIMLLDVSGSMGGEKIHSLNVAVKDMLETFRDSQSGEVEIHVAIITFGAQVGLHQPLAPSAEVSWRDLSASGGTPLGTALTMAKAMIEDKGVVPSRAYRPTVVLVSDGCPTDSWQEPLKAFISGGRSSKCERMAMAIGADADEGVLGAFIEGSAHRLFYAENAKQLRDFFKFVTMSVTTRASSKTPQVTPEASAIDVKPATIDSRSRKPGSVPPPPGGEAKPGESAGDEGYW